MTSTERREPSDLAVEDLSRALGDVRRYPTGVNSYGSIPMTIRTILSAFVALFAIQISPVAADDTASPSDAAWISFSETSHYSGKQQEFHARATRNVDPNVLKLLSAHVSRTTELRLLLKSYSDAELKFRTRNFLVIRIDGTDVTIAGGQEFPELAVRKLAKQLRTMDFHVDLVTPESLLKRSDSQGQDAPEFVVHLSLNRKNDPVVKRIEKRRTR